MPKLYGEAGARPRVLILCPEAPWPMHGGGPLRTASLVHFFAARADVDLIVFREPGRSPVEPPEGIVRKVEWIELPAHRRDPLSRAVRNAGRWMRNSPPLIDRFAGFERQLRDKLSGEHYQLAIIEHFWCAAYVALMREYCDRVWLDLHNVESEWHETLAVRAPLPARTALRRFAAACRSLERELLPRFDRILAPSEYEAAASQKITNSSSAVVYPNGLPMTTAPARAEEDMIAFSGNLEYQPNIDAVAFFHRQIWPALRERHPQLRWRIIGKNPGAVAGIVRGDEGVEFSGAVDDAIAELSRARVAVVPLLAGSGTRLKILEAWAAGTPVVSTSFGARGLGAAAGEELLTDDDPHGFADAVSALLNSAERRLSLSAAGRRVFERRFTWPAVWRDLASHAAEIEPKLQSLYTG
jgi:glycosyltransferase involved in cell wall biosynthesis